MTFGENLRLALVGLWANKLRAILTLLGIIIGIASVVTILTISAGVTRSVTDSLGSMGSQDMYLTIDTKENIAQMQQNKGTGDGSETLPEGVEPYEDLSGTFDMGTTSQNTDSEEGRYFTTELLAEIREKFADSVKGIGITGGSAYGTASGPGGSTDADLQTTNQDFLIGTSYEMVAGRGFEAEEIESGEYVAVVTDTFVKHVLGSRPEEAVGKSFDFECMNGDFTFQIIGVVRQVRTRGAAGMLFSDSGEAGNSFLAPYSVQEEVADWVEPGFGWATVRPIPGIDARAFQAKLQAFLDRQWEGSEYGVMIDSMQSMMDEVNKIFRAISDRKSVV